MAFTLEWLTSGWYLKEFMWLFFSLLRKQNLVFQRLKREPFERRVLRSLKRKLSRYFLCCCFLRRLSWKSFITYRIYSNEHPGHSFNFWDYFSHTVMQFFVFGPCNPWFSIEVTLFRAGTLIWVNTVSLICQKWCSGNWFADFYYNSNF